MSFFEPLEGRRLFAALVHQELHRPPTAIADLNGDGLADLVVVRVRALSPGGVLDPSPATRAGGGGGGGGGGSGGVLGFDVYLNAGDGDFRFAKGYIDFDNIDLTAIATDVAIGDLNGDGFPDVALKLFSVTGQPTPVGRSKTTEQVVILFVGTGKGDFEQRGSFVLPHVLDTSGGSRRAIVPKHVFDRSGLAVGDVNGDGLPDLVSWQDDNVVTVLSDARGGPRQTTSQDGTFSHGTIRGNSRIVGLGDLDADGDMDLIAYDEDAPTILVASWDPKEKKPILGAKIDATVATLNGKIDSILIGDLDGDGATDDLAVLSGNQVTVGTNQSKPDPAGGPATLTFSWGAPQRLPGGVKPVDVHVGDLDGDGTDDLFSLRKHEFKGHVTLIR